MLVSSLHAARVPALRTATVPAARPTASATPLARLSANPVCPLPQASTSLSDHRFGVATMHRRHISDLSFIEEIIKDPMVKVACILGITYAATAFFGAVIRSTNKIAPEATLPAVETKKESETTEKLNTILEKLKNLEEENKVLKEKVDKVTKETTQAKLKTYHHVE